MARWCLAMKRKYFLALAVVGNLLVGPSPVWAQTTEERAGARAAADQGYDAFKAERWSDAIDLFGRAESLVHSPTHLIFLARSHAKLGNLLEAKEAYLALLREPATTSAQVRKFRSEAEQELAEIEPRIPYVTVEIRGLSPSDAFEVTQDGRPLPRALVGVARPVNPGEHVWQARTGTQQNVTESRTIEAGTRDNKVVLLLTPEPKVAGVTEPAAVGEAAASTHDVPPPVRESSGPPALTYVGFGVGAVGAGVGVAFLLQKNSHDNELRESCRLEPNPDACPATAPRKALQSDADRAGLISAIGFITGGVGVAVAVTAWLVDANSDDADAARTQIRPWIGVGSAGVSGTF
jgi:hypothetical protein